MSSAASLDPRITRFARDASSIMSADQAAVIIGLSRHSICALCRSGQIDGESVKTNKNGFEVEPWKKPGCGTWQQQCNAGDNAACAKYESTCQVN